MKKLIPFVLVSVVALFWLSCDNAEDPMTEDPEDVFLSKTIVIDTTYPVIDPVATNIMEKLQICAVTDSILNLPPCSAELFRVFQYRPDKEWKDGFIVEMIPGVYGSPVHQIVIVENYFGKYRIV